MGSLRLALCTGALAAAVLSPAAYAADGNVLVTPGSPTPGSDIRLRVQGCAGKSGTAASRAFVADARLTGQSGALTGGTRIRSTLDPGTYGVEVTCAGFGNRVEGTVTVVDKKQRDEGAKDEQAKDEQAKKQRQQQEKQQQREQEEKQQREQQQREQEEKQQREQEQRERQEQQEAREDAPASPAASAPASASVPASASAPVTVPASPVAPVHAGGGGSARLAASEDRSEGPGARHAVVGLVLAGVAAVAVVVSSVRRGRGRTD